MTTFEFFFSFPTEKNSVGIGFWTILGHVGASVQPFWGCQSLSWAIWKLMLTAFAAIFSFPTEKKSVGIGFWTILGHVGTSVGQFWGCQGLSWAISKGSRGGLGLELRALG